MAIRSRYGKIATVGAGDTAVGSHDFYFHNPVQLISVHLDFTGQGAENTIDVTLVNKNQSFLLSTNQQTDEMVYPRAPTQDASDAAITSWFEQPILHGTATLNVVQGSASDPAVEAILYYHDFI